jgi:hypothetical protein
VRLPDHFSQWTEDAMRLTKGMLVLGLLGTAAPSRQTLQEYSGRYSWGFERSRFSACEAHFDDRPWWVTLSDHALAQRDSALAAAKEPVGSPIFVRWKGVAGDRGHVGHLGAYTRYFTAYELLELRAVRPADCPEAPTCPPWGYTPNACQLPSSQVLPMRSPPTTSVGQ